MGWLKDVYLDFVVLLIIVVFAIYEGSILHVVLWVYTSLLLLSKILAFFMPSLRKKADNTSAPQFIYHGIYGLTVGILIYTGYYYLAGTWAIIWLVSFINTPAAQKKTQSI